MMRRTSRQHGSCEVRRVELGEASQSGVEIFWSSKAYTIDLQPIGAIKLVFSA